MAEAHLEIRPDKAAPGAEEYSGPVAPWDMKADAEPRYPGDDSIYSPDTRDKIMSVMAGDDRRVWQHADFNGMHIATNIDAKDQDDLNAKVRALGGELEPEEQHHNLGATRFIPKNLNIEDYEVRESMTEGGPGSGNYGHDGRPGQRGGSMPGDRKQAVFMIGGPASGKGATVDLQNRLLIRPKDDPAA